MSTRLGEVRWPSVRGTRVAYLNSDGTWDVPGDALLSRVLVQLTDSDESPGPAAGPFGPAQLDAAARALGGTATVYPTRPDPPGMIY